MKNLVLCKDFNGNSFRVKKDDPRYLNGELKPIAKGFVVVKDFNGNSFRVKKDDPRYLNGELVFISSGLVNVIYNNKIFECKPNHPNILNGLYKILKGNKNKYIHKKTHQVLFLFKEDPLVVNQEVEKYLKYIITVKDKLGKCFTVFKWDKRLISNEVIPVATKHTINCKVHGFHIIRDQKRKKEAQIPEKYKIYCPECIKFYLSDNYKPSKLDKLECKKFLDEFNFISSNQQTEKYFKKNLSKFYTIIKKEFNNLNKDQKINFAQKIFLFKNGNKIPICNVKGCNNNVELYKNGLAFHLYCRKHEFHYFSSKGENEIFSFIEKNYNEEILQNYRKLGIELDIYIPDLKLAFEFNGIYWHSDLFKNKKYHYDKYMYFKNKNINLINIWEDDWNYKKDIIKSIILNKLNKNKNKINGRQCQIKIVNNKDKTIFLNKNHLQGNSQSSINLGLFYNDELVSLMTFGKKRKILGQTSKENEYELLRFCSKLNTSVIGGASKLFKHFIRNYKPNKIISYASCDISDGSLYKILGFNEIGHTGINYWWVKDKRYHRSGFMKHKLVREGADPNKTENQIMHEDGFNKIWGTGNLKYEFTI